MSDIFREVDEAMQQEKLLNIWNEYKNTIIAAIAILIISAGATTFYKNWNMERNAQETQKLMSALDSADPQQGLAALIQNTRKNQKTLGQFSLAALALETDNTEEAARLYGSIAENSKSPRAFRDLARILYVQNAKAPSVDILKPLLADEKSPWIWHARVEAAVITANTKNNYDGALEYLTGFNDITTIPLSLKQRGIALQHVYGIKAKANDAPSNNDNGEEKS